MRLLISFSGLLIVLFLCLSLLCSGCMDLWAAHQIAVANNPAYNYRYLGLGVVTTLDGKKYGGYWRMNEKSAQYEQIAKRLHPDIRDPNSFVVMENDPVGGGVIYREVHSAYDLDLPLEHCIPSSRVAEFRHVQGVISEKNGIISVHE